MRSLRKMWRNGPGGKWTCRIKWYDDASNAGPSGEDIRLQLEDSERKVNIYPRSVDHADNIWFMFRRNAPTIDNQLPMSTPLVAPLLELIKGRGMAGWAGNKEDVQ